MPIGCRGAPLTNFKDGEGGPTEVHILYPKNHNFKICLPQKITTLLAYPPPNTLVLFTQPQKIPLFFSRPPKNPGVFQRPKKITLGQNFRPPKKSLGPPILKICEWGPWDQLYPEKLVFIQDCLQQIERRISGNWKHDSFKLRAGK